MIEFGTKVTDKINGFTGIVTGRDSYWTGCDRSLVESQTERKDGCPVSMWIDNSRLEIVKEGAVEINFENEIPGGPADAPPSPHSR